MKFAVDTSSTEEEKRREVMGLPMVRTFADRVYMMLRTADDMVRECQKYATTCMLTCLNSEIYTDRH